jgi:hypothetical protein
MDSARRATPTYFQRIGMDLGLVGSRRIVTERLWTLAAKGLEGLYLLPGSRLPFLQQPHHRHFRRRGNATCHPRCRGAMLKTCGFLAGAPELDRAEMARSNAQDLWIGSGRDAEGVPSRMILEVSE